MKKLFLYVLPPISAFVMTWWPGALQITFFFQAMTSMIQAALLRRNGFRRLIGIQPLISQENKQSKTSPYSGNITRQPDSNIPDSKRKGIFGGAKDDIQGAFSSVKKLAKEQAEKQKGTGKRTPGEIQHAKAYDDRRKREMAQFEFEKKQLLKARRSEEAERRERQKLK